MMREHWWTDYEVQILKLHYPKGGSANCKPFLTGRTNRAINLKARKMGVKGDRLAAQLQAHVGRCQIVIPAKANPLIKQLFLHLKKNQITFNYAAEKSGWRHTTIAAWGRNKKAGLGPFMDVCASVGLEIKLVEMVK